MGDLVKVRLQKDARDAGARQITVISPDQIAAAQRGTSQGGLPSIEGVWMGPGTPPQVIVTAGTDAERKLDYPVNYNTRFNPKSGEGVTFQMLRVLADAYDLLRVIIERRKDQVEAFEWKIQPREMPKAKKPQGPPKGSLRPYEDPKLPPAEGEPPHPKPKAPPIELEPALPGTSDDDIAAVTKFLQQPSSEYSWSEWTRVILEDLLVLDAVAIVPRFTRAGGLYSLDPVDPATIKRVIDGRGMTPMPPDPAYQQIIKGVPATDFTVEELYYWMRNPRSWRTYGFSPVEYIIITVNIALNRQAFTLSHFTEGNIPEALASVPEGWTTAQVKEFQTYWDDLMSNNIGNRRRLRWIPTDANKIKEMKEADLENKFDEWLARLVCFAFSISPSALVKDTNRATAQTNQNTATAEGLMPLLNLLRTKINYIIQNLLGYPNLQFVWDFSEAVDPLQQAEIDQIYLSTEVITPDEVRSDLGRLPLTPEERDSAFPAPPAPIVAPSMGAAGGGEKPGGTNPGATKPTPAAAPSKLSKADIRAIAKELARMSTQAAY